MENRKFMIDRIPVVCYGESSDRCFLYIHRKMGFKEEAESFVKIACTKHWLVGAVSCIESVGCGAYIKSVRQMQLGITISLQKHLKIKTLPYGNRLTRFTPGSFISSGYRGRIRWLLSMHPIGLQLCYGG